MGAKPSALKREVAALQAEARKRSTKHQEELEAASKEKRLLQVKIDELQAVVALAQQDAEKTKSEAREREERMKALKWELVRQLKLTGSSSTSPRASLSPSSSARIALSWRLNEDVALRQSVVSPKKEPSNAAASDSTPETTAATASLLLAPRRSLNKRAEPSAASSPTPNQAIDADAKEAETPSETTVKLAQTVDSKTSSDDPPPSELKHNDPCPAKTNPRESKSENSSDDDRSPSTTDSKDDDDNKDDAPQILHAPSAESKDSEAGSPETNDIFNFSDSS
ncbi:hypothetical protein PRIC1_000259 [Phytophthora ramorum]|uniref:uncharacterized protein n=1 Tax=Phytophthora ramorum TaxID=164328 RepID=UPI00309BF9D7|nr:hypothetical protein KRP23_6936 [Phytophthora ramorum]